MTALFKRKKHDQGEAAAEEKKPLEKEEASPVVSLPKSGDPSSYGIVLSPYITEKSSVLNSQNKYVFKVTNTANEFQIKKAIERLYGVKVKKVNTMNTKPKRRRIGRHEGQKPGFKKAVVALREGDKIDIAV